MTLPHQNVPYAYPSISSTPWLMGCCAAEPKAERSSTPSTFDHCLPIPSLDGRVSSWQIGKDKRVGLLGSPDFHPDCRAADCEMGHPIPGEHLV